MRKEHFKNRFNNNPHILQFKSSLKSILLRAAILGSKHSNCMTFEADASLKCTKNWTSLNEEQDSEDDKICGLPELSKVSV